MKLGLKIHKYYLEENNKIKEEKSLKLLNFCSKINTISDFNLLNFKKSEIDCWISCLNYFISKEYDQLNDFKKNINIDNVDTLFITAFTKRKTTTFLNSYFIMVKNDKEMLIKDILSGISKKAYKKIITNIRPSMILYFDKDVSIQTIEYYFTEVFIEPDIDSGFLDVGKNYCHDIIMGIYYKLKNLSEEEILRTTLRILKSHIINLLKNNELSDEVRDSIFYSRLKKIFEVHSYSLRIIKEGFDISRFYCFLSDVTNEISISEKIIIDLEYKIIESHLNLSNSLILQDRILLNSSNENEYFNDEFFQNRDLYLKNYDNILPKILSKNIIDKFIFEKNEDLLYTYFIILGDINNFEKLNKITQHPYPRQILINVENSKSFFFESTFLDGNFIDVLNKDLLIFLNNKNIHLNLCLYLPTNRSFKIINIMDYYYKCFGFYDFLNNLENVVPKTKPDYYLNIYDEILALDEEELLELKLLLTCFQDKGKVKSALNDVCFYIQKNKDEKTIDIINNIFEN